ncbi:hypothetical protein Dalk_3083 [Desulfatibacillum aliphaticivorans]|uniref:Nucleic acid-binding protein contains PIN domain-like protein n=1 Tax=Desulfatibacillum aliphaticivorans TaxID=218208 RepID=B8FBM0_DESAL|nr:type II toxin-antitoxin system VapC family toxin [Desulfatibacillum aliphaticivorans]ACL04773.1 hypothetical protein Dalk_3083 [Desulfatibacillum aliphaticivorans]
MKLWILDADVIIDLLSLGVFDNLLKHCQLHLSTTVIEEVRFYKTGRAKIQINFRTDYVNTRKVIEESATVDDLKEITELLPMAIKRGIGPGELESLAVLNKNRNLVFCSMDGLAIKSLPFLDLSQNGISVEKLLQKSGISTKILKEPHMEQYFQTKLKDGQELKITGF